MPLLTVLLVIVVAGVLLWAVTTYVPLAPPVQGLLTAVVVIALVVFVLQAFGVLHYASRLRV